MILAEVVRQRLAHIGEQRQVLDHATLAANHQLASPPTNVIELKIRHLSRAQSESREQQQDGVIAPTDGSRPIRRGEHLTDLLGRKKRWDGCVPVRADRRHRSREVRGPVPPQKEKPKKERSAVPSSRAYSRERFRVWSTRKCWIVAASNASIATPPICAT